MIGNVPFADVKMDHHGHRFSLHDYFFAKSVDSLKPGGVLALVTSHFTLDKQNAAIREYLSERADFLGAIRLPSDAFKREGTAVVTDIVFLRKREKGEVCKHCDPEWIQTAPVCIEGADISINQYFQNHPEMILGKLNRKDTLYGEGYSVTGNGNLAEQLREAISRLPETNPGIRGDQTAISTENPQKTDLNRIQTPFTPPPLPHISEGSFFVGDDRVIRQLVDGQAVPVVYGGSQLWAGGAMFGRRMGDLIGLRDKARRVLQSQNEGWPEQERNSARRDLNWAYDRFTSAYGPINKTTFSETKDGTTIRRMPNLAKFREDPDAMLVMSLEEYDETTGKATKAAIMKQDVVGKKPPVTHVKNAEEGLLVSLNQRGAVDLPFIVELYGKPEEKVIAELGDLIYLDPETKIWQTADAYLSGNVRSKLAQAEAAAPEYQRNAQALARVQPEDVLPGDIDANLGAPWIPTSDIQAFAAELFQVEPSTVTVAHVKQDALWSLDAGYAAEQSVAAKSDFGTTRANGTWLFDLALNQKSPTIYDPDPEDPDKRVINPEETLKAKEKQRQIKDTFKGWVFSDPDRTERLVRTYNDTYNNLRPRLFDGSHLDFPGMSEAFHLRQHQKDAIWRIMSAGNTLLAHCVGAGKTSIKIAAGMKMKQAGLIHKPMFVVPNHMLEQYSREFLQLYPNAKILVASKDDFTKDRRKFLTAKIASGDWDGIIVTHSSFERIAMSKDYQEKFLLEQIEEYDQLIRDNASAKGKGNRNIIKTLEKQKVQRVEKLKDLLAQDKKDSGLVFDELGVDHLFIDESHYAKNLEIVTKMDRVAGIQTGGSERAFDLYMKCRYLHERHPGHGVTFATGTPISNSLCEMYTIQRFLDPEGLRSRGIEHFDAWAAQYGQVVDAMEISPDGRTLKPRSRFAQFQNIPELQQMFRAFSDVQTAEMLNLPRPRLEGGKPQVVACPMSEEQQEIQQELVKRYERIRNGGVDPREDNALAITTDGRKLGLDARMLDPAARDFPGSKINALIENVYRIWERTAPKRSTQMVFCDMGVHPTPWGYSVYDEIMEKLVARGIPRAQIATIGDADSDAKKQALFEKVRQGTVRLLLGSTQKMGTGTNAQRRLIAKHDADAPWRPADVEQRDGRILRQGNENEEVAIYRYVTEGSFDAFMWQTLETKAKFINQIMTGNTSVRRAEDIGGQEMSYAEVKAIASGNPAVLVLAETDAELQRLTVLKRNHADEQFLARRNVKTLPETITRLTERLAGLTVDMETLKTRANDPVAVNGRSLLRDDVIGGLGVALESLPSRVMQSRRFPLGMYKGLRFGIILDPSWSPEVYVEGETLRKDSLSRDHNGPRTVMNAVQRLAEEYPRACAVTQQDLTVAENQLRDYHARLGKAFPHDEYMTKLAALRDRLKISLSDRTPVEGEEKQPGSAEIAEEIKALRAGQVVETAPQRTEKRQISAEEPVTARIRRRAEKAVDSGDEDVPDGIHQQRIARESRAASGRG